jgi:excinuclease ABC subunit A
MWRGEKGKMWLSHLVEHAADFGFPIHKPYTDLSDDQKEVLWTGNAFFEGIDAFLMSWKKGL